MNLWHDIPLGPKTAFNTIVEVPKLSRIKYELDKETGLIHVDRVLYSPMHYPVNYGFAPRTYWDDGDPLDILILSHEAFAPGVLVSTRPVGLLNMTDGGEDDVKVLTVPTKDPRFNRIKNLRQIEPHVLEEIKHFFKVYKDLQKKEVKVGDWQSRAEAIKAVEHSAKLYKEKYPQA